MNRQHKDNTNWYLATLHLLNNMDDHEAHVRIHGQVAVLLQKHDFEAWDAYFNGDNAGDLPADAYKLYNSPKLVALVHTESAHQSCITTEQ